MLFHDAQLSDALNDWTHAANLEERACGHNLLFDERLTGARGDFFETLAAGSTLSADQLRRRAIDYYEDYVRVSTGIPHTFVDLNAAASLKPLAPELRLIRVESLREPLEKMGLAVDDLVDALSKDDPLSEALLETFVDDWNTRHDIRRNPLSFAANKDQCLAEISSPDWPIRLRDRFGLSHYDGTRSGPIPVALNGVRGARHLRSDQSHPKRSVHVLSTHGAGQRAKLTILPDTNNSWPKSGAPRFRLPHGLVRHSLSRRSDCGNPASPVSL